MTDPRSPIPARPSPIKVLIVDDSAVVRQHLKHIFEADGDILVVGMAVNGEEAVRFVQGQRPDVITMDVIMPKMNGHEATRRIMETHPVPIVIVTASFNRGDVEKSFLAMEAGAVAIVEKPFGMDSPDYDIAKRELVQTVKLMSEVRVVKRWNKVRLSGTVGTKISKGEAERISNRVKIVAIGASTGGPPVLQTIISCLPRGFPVPLMIVQHIAKGFLEGMTEWLRHTTTLPIHIAAHGEHLLPGHVYFAPDDFHMGVGSGSRIGLSKAAPENNIRPSVSYLFRSVMQAFEGSVIGVLLTGMGKDGAEELGLMKEKGAATIVQDQESSVVYGMPGEAIKLGAAMYVLPPEKIPIALENLVNRKEGE